MSAVLFIPRGPRRASVPGRVLLPWVLAVAGCFAMALGVGHGPADAAAAPVPIVALASTAQPPVGMPQTRVVDRGANSVALADHARPAGSPLLRALGLLAFVAAMAAAVLGSYRGYALNGD